MLRIVCFLLIACGGVLMSYSAIKYLRLVRTDLDNMPSYSKTLKWISFGMMVLFIIGYVVGAIDVLVGVANPMYYFISIIFFMASLFAFFLMKYITLMTNNLTTVKKQLETHSKNLEAEIAVRMDSLLRQDRLLHAVNDVASLLLSSEDSDFEAALWKSMGMLAQCVDVDRMYIWKNHEREGQLRCTQIYEWSEGAEPQQGIDITVDISYDENIPGWEQKFKRGESVSGLVRNLSLEEQNQLLPQGIISILVVPVYLQERFWGFVGFDDCQKEREFSAAEEGILRSASLLVANALLRNQMNQSLLQAQKAALASTQAKSRFLSNMSHEIRTPINAISGMATIAQKNTGDPEKMRDCLTKIDAATRQLLAIINDILDMSKIEAGKIEMTSSLFDLHEALYNVKSIAGVRAAEKEQDFTLSIAPGVPRAVVGDDVRLSQILLNLLSNAIKFTPEQGTVSLRVDVAEEAAQEREGWCCLSASVTDTGIGLSDEQKSRLFQAFEQAELTTTRRYGGTGLGLAISQRLASLMDGAITVESTLGQGSCFTLRVWLQRGDEALLHADTGADASNAPTGDLQGRTVLVVEDIAINREIMLTLLAEQGIIAYSAENGQQAVELFCARPSLYDLILMDVHMPVMDGFTATRTIRGQSMPRAREIPIVAMTANVFTEDIEKCIESGMNDHLGKPVDYDMLLEKLRRYLPVGS